MSNDTQVQAITALVDQLIWNGTLHYDKSELEAAIRAAVEASARQLSEQRVVDKAELKRLVTLVFGDDFQIVRQAASPTAPTEASEPGSTAEAAMFTEWAGEKGYDVAHTYDTERSRWLFLNPMTADLWKCWQAARALKGTP